MHSTKYLNREEFIVEKDENDKYIIPSHVQKSQYATTVPLYVINKNGILWYSNTNRNNKVGDLRTIITKDNISSVLLNIILHNNKTNVFDNFTRLDYIVKASNALLSTNRGIASLPTGAGKSLIIAVLVEQMQDSKVLIVAPSRVIVGQIQSLLKKINIKNVDTMTHLMASKITPDTDGQPKYDCIIFDECHKMSCNTYIKSLFRSNTDRIYGLSASIQEYGTSSAKFHIGSLVYKMPYSLAREMSSSINGIKYFHKFPFSGGKDKTDAISQLKDELNDLHTAMIRQVSGIKDRGYFGEMQKNQIVARFVNMGFILAEKSQERNMFISSILKEIASSGLLNITFLRTKECGRLLIKMMPPKSTLLWYADGMYIYDKEGDERLKKVDYSYVDQNFGLGLNNILATSCLQMGVNLQFTNGTINSILLLSGSTHNSLAQQVGRAIRCNPSNLPARAHTILDKLPLLDKNADNRIKDLSNYFELSNTNEILHSEDDYINEYRKYTQNC
jgi:hypothetical protein